MDRRLANRCVATLIAVAGLAAPCSAQESAWPHPEASTSVIETLSPFTDAPDSSRVAGLLEVQAAESGAPSSADEHLLAARLWRQAGEWRLAAEALHAARVTAEEAGPVAYEAARMLFESGRDAAGAGALWRACAARDEPTRAEIGWDLLTVMTPEERELWPAVEPGEPTCDWLRAFWDERALRAASRRDARIGTHYRRLADAHRRFHLDEPRFEQGMAEAYGRPAGIAVDDRGLLWIRLGPPDEDLACPDEVAVEGPLNVLGRCWVYWRPGGYRIFYLATRDRFGYDLPYGDYRIQENLSQQAEPGTELFHKYVMNADLPATTKRQLVLRGPASRNAKLALAGLQTTVDDELSDDLDLAEFRALHRQVRDATRRHAAEALEQIPDRPPVESTATIRFETLRFLNPASSTWQVWVIASVRAGDLVRVEQKTEVGGRFFVLTDEGLFEEPLGTVIVRHAPPDDHGVTLRGMVAAPPGALPLTIVIEDRNAPGTGAWTHDTVNVPSVGGLPQLSDIAVAQSAGGAGARADRTFMRHVTPTHITRSDGSIWTYFEAYGVRPETSYDVEFRMIGAAAADRIWRLEPDDLAFRLAFTSEMPGDIGRHLLRLDLGDTQPGRYVLAVRIQDEESGAYSLPSVTDVFVAER